MNEDPDSDMELAREEGVFWVSGERRIRWTPGKKHTLECHNVFMARKMVCPYCKAGSVPVPRDEIVNGSSKGGKD